MGEHTTTGDGHPPREQDRGGAWMDEDSTTGDGHPPRDQRARFRHHWQSRYASGGGTFDDYYPAYDHGYRLREEYSSRRWEDVQPDVKQRWESNQPGTWERFKEAIRQGWDRLTGSDDSTR